MTAPPDDGALRPPLDPPMTTEDRILLDLESLCAFMDEALATLNDGVLCDLGPLARGVASICGDIQSLDRTTAQAFVPVLEALLGRYETLETALVERARASGLLDTPPAPHAPAAVRAAYERLGSRPPPPPAPSGTGRRT